MGKNSSIEWTDHTFNPWWGCEEISPACANCYARTWAKRVGQGNLWEGGRRRMSDTYWRQPLRWERAAAAAGVRARVFCASMADVFDNAVPDQWRADLWDLIEMTPHLDWLLLTKRIGNAMRMLRTVDWAAGRKNVWLGATICNQEEADRDILKLLATPARVRFLSIEPMLGPIDLTREYLAAKLGSYPFPTLEQEHRTTLLDLLDWVIVGGESGHHARPMHPSWPRSIRDQCAAAGVPFLFKQYGEWSPAPQGGTPATITHGSGDSLVFRVGKKAAGRMLDGVTHDGFPVPAA